MVESKLGEGLKQYNEKRKLGLVIQKKPRNPIQIAKDNPKSLRKAINAKCWDCSCFQSYEITKCQVFDCSLWNLRPYQPKRKNNKIQPEGEKND